MNLRKDHSCDHTAMVMFGRRAGVKPVLSRLLCPNAQQSWIQLALFAQVRLLVQTYCALKISATDVLVHMLMKGAAKCSNHCELQNSVNQLTIERRSALGAFLRACLCQCFHTYSGSCPILGHDGCASSVMLVASSVVAAMRGACYLHCCADNCL